MEYDTEKAINVPMTDLAKDIKRQRTLIEDNTKQMVDDIQHFILSYFERSGNDTISLEKNPYPLYRVKSGYPPVTAITFDRDTKDIILNSREGKSEKGMYLKNFDPIVQAWIFEHIVEQFSKACVYVVFEQRFDPMDCTRTRVVGTFKRLENAQECLGVTVEETQNKYPEIWEEWLKEQKPSIINNKNEYSICSSSYFYDIKVVEQVLEDEEW